MKEKTKKEEFEANPENFINVHDCLLVVKREDKEDKKFYSVMNNCKSIEDVYMAQGFVDEALQNRRDMIRVAQAQKAAGGIQVASKMPVMPSNGEKKPFKLFR